MIRPMFSLALLLCISWLCLSCGEEKTARLVSQRFENACAFAECGAGACIADGDGVPSCLCEVGYVGAKCESCAEGFHYDTSRTRCLADQRCAELARDPCGPHGSCVDQPEQGVIACSCNEHHEGPRCMLCSEGFEHNAGGTCVERVAVPMASPVDPPCLEVGTAGINCALCQTGFHRNQRGECEVDPVCQESSCPENSTCSVLGGAIQCTCDEGYYLKEAASSGGAAAPVCEPLSALCTTNSCPARATCIPLAPNTRPACVCEEGYDGADCEACAAGFVARGGMCIRECSSAFDEEARTCEPGSACEQQTCGAPSHMICGIQDRTRVCTCDTGYSGDTCSECAAGFLLMGTTCVRMCSDGYHVESGSCVVDEVCAPSSCPNNAACTVESGQRVCTCNAGYTGDLCTDCAAGFVRMGATCLNMCSPGFHTENGTCVVDNACVPNSCPANSTCATEMGRAVCTCNPGYVGEDCDDCAATHFSKNGSCVTECGTGFHLAGRVCVVDQVCEPNSCEDQGNSHCELQNGLIHCPCDPGWGPEGECDVCQNIQREQISFEGLAGWPTSNGSCTPRKDLTVGEALFRGRAVATGQTSSVNACAASDVRGFANNHIGLAVFTNQPALMQFAQPVELVNFTVAAGIDAVDVDLYAHETLSGDLNTSGRLIGRLNLTPRTRVAASTLLPATFTPRIRALTFRGRNAALQTVYIDDVNFGYPECN